MSTQKEKYSAQVIKLKKGGMSVNAIAEKLKISRGVVNNIWYTANPTANMKSGKKRVAKPKAAKKKAGKKKSSKKAAAAEE